MSDGLTVPFALTAGLSGVLNTNHLIIVSGLSEIAAGCISMGLGGYLAGESELDHYNSELKSEFSEIESVPDTELKEVNDILVQLGVDKALSSQVALQISKDKVRWADFVMKLELNMEQPVKNRAAKSATTIALSYLVGGFIPLFPYIIFKDSKDGFHASCIVTIIAAAAAYLLAKAVS